MSDIYLQITETPTVVTLSAPVISGALSSTVTVANVVTVALDSNSLSALESVTVTVGAAITGTVTVSNFPATQTIAGTVTANNSVLSDVLEYDGNNFFLAVGGRTAGGKTDYPINISGTVTIGAGTVTIGAGTAQIGSVTASISNFPATQTIAGTVTANVPDLALVVGENQNTPNPAYGIQIGYISDISGTFVNVSDNTSGYQQLPIKGAVTANLGSALPAGTNRIGVVTIGAGTVTIGAGTAQIGSVTASISNSLTIGSLPAISGTVTANLGTAVVQIVNAIQDGDGTTFGIDRDFPVSGAVQIQAGSNQIGSVTASISNSVTIASLPAISGTVTANTFALQGTAVTTSNFTSTTASTVLANFNATREVLTIFNEGAGNLHICAGATCTTIAYQVRLSAGDYYEVPNHQTTITHSAVFATAGTARVTEVS